MILLFLLITANCKRHYGTFLSDELKDSMTYFTKFGINVGSGSLELRVRLANPRNEEQSEQYRQEHLVVKFSVFIDDSWNLYQDQEQCYNKARLSKYTDKILIPKNGDWSATFRRDMHQKNRDHIWFFVINDCEGLLKRQGDYLEFDIQLTNNGSQFSCEINYFHILYMIQLMIAGSLLLFCFEKLKGTDDLNNFLTGIFLVLCVNCTSELLIFLHYTLYAFNGRGFWPIEVLGSTMGYGAGLLLSGLLILAAQGWTITKANPEYLEQVPKISAIILPHTLFTWIMKLQAEKIDQYHNFYGIGGWMYLLLKIFIWIYFTLQLRNTFRISKKEQTRFLVKIGIAGSIFLLTYPVAVLIADSFIAPYWRLRAITMANVLITNLCIGFLVYSSTSKASTYFYIKNQSQTII